VFVLLTASILVLIPARADAQEGSEESIAPASFGSSASEPRDLRDVNAWVAWKNAQQIGALPAEARLFYRRGLMAHQSGQPQEALANLRGAIELDPSFLQPHLTLANRSVLRDPAQMLQHCAALLDRWRLDFTVQINMVANALVLSLEALFAGLLFAGLFIVVHRRDEFAHGLHEELARYISPQTARWWVPLILVLPFLAGAGLTLPVLAFLGFLWPLLRVRERILFVMLALAAVTAPLALSTLDRFALALRTDAGPFYEMPLLENATFDPARQERLEGAARRAPGNGFAQFALAWHSRRGGRLDEAEQGYRAALKAWPEHDAVLTNLGNVAAMRGHADEAIAYYLRAAAANPANAAAHFNASQLHLRRFEYTAANEELRLASAIDFDLVKDYQSRAGTAGLLPLMDVWPAPQLFWTALRTAERPRGATPLPLVLRGRLETSGWGFSLAAVLAVVLGVRFGQWQHRRLPLRTCSNCGVVVCRRCAKRRREAALCPECERIGAGAETQEFSRVLLLQHRALRRDRARLGRTALAALVPGYGLLAHHRVFGPTLLIAFTWLLARLTFGFSAPFSVTPRMALPGGDIPGSLLLLGMSALYAWSLGSYLYVVARERERELHLDAASHGRITQASRRQSTLAA
jgi:Tfp pilus assembly protein PilF